MITDRLTPEERAEINAFWRRSLTSLSDAEFRRFIILRRLERGQGDDID